MTTSQKGAGVSILIVNKMDFRTKYITNDKEGHFIILAKSVYQKDKTTANTHILINRTQNHKAKLDNRIEQIDNSTIMLDTSTTHSQKLKN